MASGHYNDGAIIDNHYLVAPDMNTNMYDGTSSESSASSPMNCNGFDNLYGSNNYMTYPTYPMHYPVVDNLNPLGLIPVDIEEIYEEHDRRRRKNSGSEKAVSSHVHSRRRAQNRASQRAFRDRKEKHMRELEQRLGELEGRHTDLSRSYESLQTEYSSVKQELERMRKESSREEHGSGAAKHYSNGHGEIMDPLLFDVSAFCFDQGEGHRKD